MNVHACTCTVCTFFVSGCVLEYISHVVFTNLMGVGIAMQVLQHVLYVCVYTLDHCMI